VALVTAVGRVLAAVNVGDPAFVSVYVKLTELAPLGIISVFPGEKVPEDEELLSVIVRSVSAVTPTLLLFCRCTVMVLDTCPATKLKALLVKTNLVAVGPATAEVAAASSRTPNCHHLWMGNRHLPVAG